MGLLGGLTQALGTAVTAARETEPYDKPGYRKIYDVDERTGRQKESRTQRKQWEALQDIGWSNRYEDPRYDKLWESKYLTDKGGLTGRGKELWETVKQITADTQTVQDDWKTKTEPNTAFGGVSYQDAQKALAFYKYRNPEGHTRSAEYMQNYDKLYAEGIQTIRDQGMTMHGLPVDIDAEGKAHYNLDVIGRGLGLEQDVIDQIKEVGGYGSKNLTDDLQQLEQAAGIRDWAAETRKDYYDTYAVTGNSREEPQKIILANFADADPVWARVNLNSEDELYHMSRPGFVGAHGQYGGAGVKDALGASIDPGWGEMYGGAIMTGLASAINPFMGAAMATMLYAAPALQEGEFSWTDLALEAAQNFGSAYIGGAANLGTLGETAARAGLDAGIDIAQGDFDLQESLIEAGTNLITDVGMDAITSGVQGGIAGYQSGEGVLSGIGSGLGDMSIIGELTGYGESIGLLDAPLDSEAINTELESFFGDVDDASLQMQSELDPGYEGAGYISPIVDNRGIGFDDSDWSYGDPSEAAKEEMAENWRMEQTYGTGGQWNIINQPYYNDDVDWSYGMPSEDAQAEMAGMASDAGQIFLMKNAEILPGVADLAGGDSGYWDQVDPGKLWQAVLPGILGSIGKRPRRKTEETEEQALYDDSMYADTASSGGALDPYSQQQMFGAGIQ